MRLIFAVLLITSASATQVEPNPCEDPTLPECDSPVSDPDLEPEPEECSIDWGVCLGGFLPGSMLHPVSHYIACCVRVPPNGSF